ncbi:TonB-dependent receptor [Massilia sp. DJPM01]|nr:TonB-dependent receptor [Massilia sp. DJPM01]MDM5181697.1 TonB-dependent receptor [Massilia sp. DJPM01]
MSHRLPFKAAQLAALQSLATLAGAQQVQDSGPVVTIFGSGQTRQVQNITRDDLANSLPGTNALKTLEKLPGVHFESADPFGTYEWSSTFSMRGFAQNQIGYTLDGVPLGDMAYANSSGLHISRAITAENIARVTVSQGAGDVGTASISNLGGTVQFFSADPNQAFGVSGAQTFGSSHTYRSFARLDTGLMASGTKAYASLMRQRAHKWKGDHGPQNLDQFNTKLVHRLGAHRLSVFYNYSDRLETDYQDMSLEMTPRLGWDWDNYAPDWQRAVKAANGVYGGAVTSLDDAYYLGRGLRRDTLGGATLDARLSGAVALKSTVYHHSHQGQGHWYTPYSPTSARDPISIRTSEYGISRNGVAVNLLWDAGAHAVDAGVWIERNNHVVTRNFYAADGSENSARFLRHPISTGFIQDFSTKTRQFHLQDTITLCDGALTVNVGLKSPKVAIDTVAPLGTRAAGSLSSSKSVLPQFGLQYDIDKDQEVFASVSHNMRAFNPGAGGPFSQNQTAFDLSAPVLKPETSRTLELGYRFKQGSITGSLAAYAIRFKDRLATVANCSGILGCPSSFLNVGKVDTNGVETAMVWTLARHWTWFNAFTYSDSACKSDYLDGATLVAANGKQVVDTPKTMFNTELSYGAGPWSAHALAKHTSKRYYTFLNDAFVPAYWVLNLSAGYRMTSVGTLKDVTLLVSATNVLDKRYYSTVGTNGFLATDPGRSFQTLLVGAPRQLFVTLSAKL